MAPSAVFRQAGFSSLPVMPRPRYRQDPLPLGDCAPPPTLYGPEQLGVVPLGPLFEGTGAPEVREQLEPEG